MRRSRSLSGQPARPPGLRAAVRCTASSTWLGRCVLLPGVRRASVTGTLASGSTCSLSRIIVFITRRATQRTGGDGVVIECARMTAGAMNEVTSARPAKCSGRGNQVRTKWSIAPVVSW